MVMKRLAGNFIATGYDFLMLIFISQSSTLVALLLIFFALRDIFNCLLNFFRAMNLFLFIMTRCSFAMARTLFNRKTLHLSRIMQSNGKCEFCK